MATTIDTSSNPLAAYGYDQSTGKQLADSLGITPQQLASALATTPATSVSQPQSGGNQYGKSGPGPTMGRDLGQTLQTLSAVKAAGGLGGGGNQQQQGPMDATSVPLSQNAQYGMATLGAAALGNAGFSGPEGGFVVYNPTPTGGKSGVGNVVSPTQSNAIPGSPNLGVAGVFSSQGQIDAQKAARDLYQKYAGNVEQARPQDIATFYKGMTGQDVNTPGSGALAPTSGGTPTAMIPANAAGAAVRPATPFATAPAAPGIQVPSIPDHVHNNALADAGQSLFSHFGGDPATATHDDIRNFHSMLTSMLGAQTGSAPSGVANYTAGASTAPPAPIKASSGGMVPGQGNHDIVPALLTPGEYVIPKQQAAQLFGGRAPIRMESGGFVPDDTDSNELPEVRRKRLLTGIAAQAASNIGNQPTQDTQGSTAPAAPGGYTGPTASQIMAQNQAANNRIGSGGQGSLDSLGRLGDEDLIGSMGVGVGSGPGSGMPTKQATGVISGLFSGLQAAADSYAKSIGNYQMKAPAFSAPKDTGQPAAQFTQQKVDEQKKKQQVAQYGFDPYQG